MYFSNRISLQNGFEEFPKRTISKRCVGPVHCDPNDPLLTHTFMWLWFMQIRQRHFRSATISSFSIINYLQRCNSTDLKL